MNFQVLLNIAIEAAEAASAPIIEVYNSGNFETERKDDRSPLTLADRRAHDTIVSILKPAGLPVLSEEGKSIPYDERRHWEYFWMVDPLDGTKEFLKRNGEFTVNIALVYRQSAVLGVVAVPASGEIFYASEGEGAFLKRNGKIISLSKRSPVDLTREGLRVVASRSHMSEETQQFIQSLKNPTLVSKGSSLKFMLMAEGLADIYPRFAPTMEWDTAAAHAIVNEVGLHVVQKDNGQALVYNKADLLNPFFICR